MIIFKQYFPKKNKLYSFWKLKGLLQKKRPLKNSLQKLLPGLVGIYSSEMDSPDSRALIFALRTARPPAITSR